MSISALNSPPLVAALGTSTISFGIPLLKAAQLSLTASQWANLVAFAINVFAVSIPGRIDGLQQQEMAAKKNLNPDNNKALSSKEQKDASTFATIYSSSRGRSLVTPAGWAFAIWGPIYLGEMIFCVAQFFSKSLVRSNVIQQMTPAFVVANLCQSLWCAAFRPSYNEGWRKYVSAALLGYTALALSQVQPAITMQTVAYFIPLLMHFGWTSAATLVNLNGSFAMEEAVSDRTLVIAGHASVVLATALGMGVSLLGGVGSAVYGYTLAWALAACSSGMNDREESKEPPPLQNGIQVQKRLCQVGSVLCLGAATASFFL